MNSQRRPIWLLPVLLVLSIVSVIGCIPAAFGMAPLAIGPLSDVTMSMIVWVIPLLTVLCVVLGWVGYYRRRIAFARTAVLLAIVPILVQVAAIIWLIRSIDPVR